MPTKSRVELTQLLDALEERLPVMLAESGLETAMVAFELERDVIEGYAAQFDRPHVVGRLKKMAEILRQAAA